MKNIKYVLLLVLSLASVASCTSSEDDKKEEAKAEKVAIAYVTSWTSEIPEVEHITHINYAFGHINNSFNGVRIDNEDRLKQIVALKKKKSTLKILLSIGGWESGNFSEMADAKQWREAFALDCKRVIDKFDLDGIDVDWEYPTSSDAGISSSPADKENFTKLMADIRKAIGNNKLLTIASASTPEYIDFATATQYLDFVNIMAYDMGRAPYHHASLYRSQFVDPEHGTSADEAVKAHQKAGVPMNKLVLGVPFYGKTSVDSKLQTRYSDIVKLDNNYTTKWDEEGKVPYVVDKEGTYICGFDSPESLAIKAKYVLDNGMHGMMYWEYAGDDNNGTLRKMVYNSLNK